MSTLIAHRNGKVPYGLTFKPDSSCVLWLPGQDDYPSATIRDRSGKGNNGTITGATWTRLPSGLWGLSSSGTAQYVNCGLSASLQIANQITVLAWINVTTFNRASATYLGCDNIASSGYSILRDGSNSALDVALYNGAWRVITQTGTTSTGVWNLWGFTYDNATLTLYCNGAVTGTPLSISGNITYNVSSLFQLGRGFDVNTRCANCKIGLTRVFNRAFSASEMLTISNQERHLLGV